MAQQTRQSDTAILFVHGIQGTPKRFEFMTRALDAGTAYENIWLPGHGGNMRDFGKSRAADWLDGAKRAADGLLSTHEKLVFVGHSMGGLLGLELAREGYAFHGMLLLCCPFAVRMSRKYIKQNLRAAFSKPDTDDEFVRAAREMNGVKAGHLYEYLFGAKPYIELFGLMRAARSSVFPMKNAIFFYSELDEIVSPRSQQIAARDYKADVRMLEACGHNCFTASAQDRLIQALRWLIR